MSDDTETVDLFIARECEKIGKLCWSQRDPQLILLRAHLLIEHYMERLILMYLEKGEKVIHKRCHFARKLDLVEALDAVSERGCHAIRKLNEVRNSMVHKMYYEIANSDLDEIGKPFGKDFAEVKSCYANSPHDFLCATLNLLFREICATVFAREATGCPRPSGS
jgi:hypothetical protein